MQLLIRETKRQVMRDDLASMIIVAVRRGLVRMGDTPLRSSGLSTYKG